MQLAGRPLTTTLRDVCFLHWPVPEAVVEDVVPSWLTPDVADGTAWISVLSTAMRRVDVFGLPVRENVRAVTVRTYVRSPGGDRGVYVLSMAVDDRLVADAANRLFRVPTSTATIERTRNGGEIAIRLAGHGESTSAFEVTYEPSGATQTASPDTLPSFLAERYRYFTQGALDTRLCGSVGHEPWKLRTATASVIGSDLLDVFEVQTAETDPLAHYSDGVEMRIEPPVPLALVA